MDQASEDYQVPFAGPRPRPGFLPGCGYRALTPNAAGLRDALGRLDLTQEQREKLRKGLELDAD